MRSNFHVHTEEENREHHRQMLSEIKISGDSVIWNINSEVEMKRVVEKPYKDWDFVFASGASSRFLDTTKSETFVVFLQLTDGSLTNK